MRKLEELIAAIIEAARLAKLNLVAIEIEEIFSNPEIAKFAAAWFAGRASSGQMRRDLQRDLRELAEYATKKTVDSIDSGDWTIAARREGVSNAIVHLVSVIEYGDRYGTRGGMTNEMRFAERRYYLQQIRRALQGQE